jgi:hypothetical protein
MRTLADGTDIRLVLAGSQILSPSRAGPAFGPELRLQARIRLGEAAVGGGARPGPRFRRSNKARSYGVQLRVSQSDPKMGLVQRAGVETSLPDVARGTVRGIPVRGIASVRVL